jgi:hypothetical protein
MGVVEGEDGGFPDDMQLLTLCSESSSNYERSAEGGRRKDGRLANEIE